MHRRLLFAIIRMVGEVEEKRKAEREKKSELPELNQRPLDLQSNALPTELSSVCCFLLGSLHNANSDEGVRYCFRGIS